MKFTIKQVEDLYRRVDVNMDGKVGEEIMYTMYHTIGSRPESDTTYMCRSVIRNWFISHTRTLGCGDTFYLNFIEKICSVHKVCIVHRSGLSTSFSEKIFIETRPIAMDEQKRT